MKYILVTIVSIIIFGFTLSHYKFVMPFEKGKSVKIVQKFGFTANLFHPHFSKGMSISMPTRTKIFSIDDGLVTHTCVDTCQGGFGRIVKARYQDSIEVFYYHLIEVHVDSGDVVQRGQLIGLSGNTGRSVAPQLGLRMKINDSLVDPAKYIDFDLD